MEPGLKSGRGGWGEPCNAVTVYACNTPQEPHSHTSPPRPHPRHKSRSECRVRTGCRGRGRPEMSGLVDRSPTSSSFKNLLLFNTDTELFVLKKRGGSVANKQNPHPYRAEDWPRGFKCSGHRDVSQLDPSASAMRSKVDDEVDLVQAVHQDVLVLHHVEDLFGGRQRQVLQRLRTTIHIPRSLRSSWLLSGARATSATSAPCR